MPPNKAQRKGEGKGGKARKHRNENSDDGFENIDWSEFAEEKAAEDEEEEEEAAAGGGDKKQKQKKTATKGRNKNKKNDDGSESDGDFSPQLDDHDDDEGGDDDLEEDDDEGDVDHEALDGMFEADDSVVGAAVECRGSGLEAKLSSGKVTERETLEFVGRATALLAKRIGADPSCFVGGELVLSTLDGGEPTLVALLKVGSAKVGDATVPAKELARRLRDTLAAEWGPDTPSAPSATGTGAETETEPGTKQVPDATGLGDDDDDGDNDGRKPTEGGKRGDGPRQRRRGGPHSPPARPSSSPSGLRFRVLELSTDAADRAAAAAAASAGSGSGRRYWFASFLVAFFALLVYFRAGMESFDSQGLSMQPPSADHYAALGVPRTATAKQISAAYRALAVRLHPDKNPGCESCSDQFMAAQAAFELLRDPAKRALYDEMETSYDRIPSAAEELTAETFEQLVLRAEEGSLWVVQVYSDWHRSCVGFAPAWEDAIRKYGGSRLIRFGRVHVKDQEQLARRLPARYGIVPTLISYRSGRSGRAVTMDAERAAGANLLAAFISEEFPDAVVRVPASLAAVEAFFAASEGDAARGPPPSRILYLPGAQQRQQQRQQRQHRRDRRAGGAASTSELPPLAVRLVASRYHGSLVVGQVDTDADPGLVANLVALYGTVPTHRERGSAQSPRLLFLRGGDRDSGTSQHRPRWLPVAFTAASLDRLVLLHVLRPSVGPVGPVAYASLCVGGLPTGGGAASAASSSSSSASAAEEDDEDDDVGGGRGRSDEGDDGQVDQPRMCVLHMEGCPDVAAGPPMPRADFARAVGSAVPDGWRFGSADVGRDPAMSVLCRGSPVVAVRQGGRQIAAWGRKGTLAAWLKQLDDSKPSSWSDVELPDARVSPPPVYRLGPWSVEAESVHHSVAAAALGFVLLFGISRLDMIPNSVLQATFLFGVFGVGFYEYGTELVQAARVWLGSR